MWDLTLALERESWNYEENILWKKCLKNLSLTYWIQIDSIVKQRNNVLMSFNKWIAEQILGEIAKDANKDTKLWKTVIVNIPNTHSV